MSTTQTEEETRLMELLAGIEGVCSGKPAADVYAVLVYALGRTINMSNDPAHCLCDTIPKLAEAAKVECSMVAGNSDDLEEFLADDHNQSTH